eukprot:CAMPEP_0196650428 /NCGR_PEP_ID=MMETSP1085-20130531/16844_1 /TAXON_ID=41879 ORGANISM="Pycnococcus sp, Strain CCMP1998" /NCGR_SAMPLE_ID=MMETSP1085 /ASSEMBLY_ACC=CAM_ASM_000807 /LENGTH=224 /DNA_ID=CAMNT_0041980325 /DNA_START=114 /DNA_END=786 /DNA_ORIENTATION=+
MARPSQSRCGCAFGRRKLTLSATPLGKDHLWGVRAPSSNEVQVPLSRAGDDPSSLAVELDEAGLLELLADVTDNAAANLAKVLRPHALPVRGSVNLSELSDTDSLLEVDLPGDARGAHVVPVWVVGTQLLVAPGLDEVNVLAWSKLSLQVLGVLPDELVASTSFTVFGVYWVSSVIVIGSASFFGSPRCSTLLLCSSPPRTAPELPSALGSFGGGLDEVNVLAW